MERSIREEARRLRQGQAGGEGGAQGAAAAGRKNVDLESLSFAQGSHFNSSKQCTLPQVRGCIGLAAGFGDVLAHVLACIAAARGELAHGNCPPCCSNSMG